MSWRIEADMGYGAAPYRNRFRFATKDECQAYGDTLAYGAKSFECLESKDPVTHKFSGRSLENADAVQK